MTHRERLEAAWAHEETDRVPIEIRINPTWEKHPLAAGLMELINEYADNFCGVHSADFGFMGFPTTYSEEVIEDIPGRGYRMRRVHETPAGTFTAFTYHPVTAPADYHWEKRFISSLDDLIALIDTPRTPAPWDVNLYRERMETIGDDAIALAGLFHPLGTLVRNATMEDVYAWLYEERELMHRFLERANAYVAATVDAMQTELGAGISYVSYAHEMLIPPWMGHALFDEFVVPYDTDVYGTVRRGGGRFRCHCHGNCGGFLEKFADMGVSAIEPLEVPPTGDTDLAEAKRLVGDRMLLSGNIPSEHFVTFSPEDVRRLVRKAIRDAGEGGGFSLRTSGGYAGTSTDMPEEDMKSVIENCKTYILTALEFGEYPLKG